MTYSWITTNPTTSLTNLPLRSSRPLMPWAVRMLIRAVRSGFSPEWLWMCLSRSAEVRYPTKVAIICEVPSRKRTARMAKVVKGMLRTDYRTVGQYSGLLWVLDLGGGNIVNLKVWGHSHIWPAPATSTIHRNLSNSGNNIFYRLAMAIPKWVPNRLHCPLFIKHIISSIFHIILTHLAALL